MLSLVRMKKTYAWMNISYLRRGLVSSNLSCKLPYHCTSLWQTDSFWALPKILHHRKGQLRSKAPGPAIASLVPPLWPLCKPACKLRAKSNVASTTWSKFLIFSTGIILTSKQKWDFCVKSCNLVSWRIIIFASVRMCVVHHPGSCSYDSTAAKSSLC